MSLKKLGIALLAVFVMGAFVANSAYAENNWNATTGSGTPAPRRGRSWPSAPAQSTSR